MSLLSLSRRRAMAAGLSGILASAAMPRVAFASGHTDKRLVIVILRGAMDGLTAVPAYGDPDYERARNGIGTPKPNAGGRAGEGAALDLNGFFGLYPALTGLHARYGKGELVVFHAIASPYRDRSHFDGQNLLENGSPTPFGVADGWANRALEGLPGTLKAGRRDLGIAIAPAMPLMLRGPTPVTSWSPSILPAPSADLVARIKAMYAVGDPVLAKALDAAAAANTSNGAEHGGNAFAGLMGAAARFMAAPDGPCLAVVESTGWDTHANQLGPFGVLSRNLAALDQGVAALADGLGPKWSDTAVLIVTEFGRTVAMNGTRGTDHGTAGAAFLVGGAVNGGRVIADWPGLRPGDLYEGRDLRPTADLRGVMKAALVEHMGVAPAHVERVVFPQSQAAPMLRGLFKV